MKASREILVPRADVVSDSVLARKQFHPTIPQWWQQVVTALSVPRSPPRSGVFIAVGLPKVCLAPSHLFLSPSLRPPKQIKLVALQVILAIRILPRDKPSTHVPLLPSGSS